MAGGLLQLVAKGQQDEFISVNPDISFFKYSYKKHTNFSMESIQLTFNINPILSSSSISSGYLCKIGRYADLLSNLYFCYKLPDIYSSDVYKFRWINNVGSLLVKKATIIVGNVTIDTITGEWLNIYNSLINGEDNLTNYNKLTGNVEDLINPKMNEPRISIKNNRFNYSFYPASIKNSNIPSIKSRDIYVPLRFWFTKVPSLALPLLKLQYSDIYINMEIENVENLYQVYSEDLQKYISPTYYNELYNDHINILTFVNNTAITPYIEANYIFLDNDERNEMISSAKTDYLVEQLEISSDKILKSNNNSSTIIDLNIHKHTKEIIWTAKRDDYYKFNERNNYTASIPENGNSGILDKCSIIINKTNNRIEEKNADYFNIIQPYQHHSAIPKQGIYCYSFSLFPEKVYPTGSFNTSVVSTSLQIYNRTYYNNDDINAKLTNMNKNTYTFDYIVNVYSITYNVYEIIGGVAGMKFV